MSDYELLPEYVGVTNPDKTQVKVCTVCGFPFETSQMRKYKGKYYCRPNTCYKDIAGIRRGAKR